MDIHTATEEAYKKGFEDGKRAVDPVHCKDCIHYETLFQDWDRQTQQLYNVVYCKLLKQDFGEDGFCCLGERKVDNENFKMS